MPTDATPKSQQTRIRRYLDNPHLNFAPALLALLPIPAPWVLTLDRTNWKRGNSDINLLVLAVVVGKTAIPVLWVELSHPGNSDTPQRNSDTPQRIALIKEFLQLAGNDCIRLLTADREFSGIASGDSRIIGGDWLAWLHEQRIPFLLRIRKNTLLTHADGTCQEAYQFFRLRADGCRNKKASWDLWGTPVFVGGKRLRPEQTKTGKEDRLIVVSNCALGDLLSLYRLRWGIETFFQALKGRGFDIEGCSTSRISGFFGLLALGFVWSLRMGMYLEGVIATKVLPHGRLAQSWFRRGLDHLHRLLVVLAGRSDLIAFDRAMILLRQGFLPAKNCL